MRSGAEKNLFHVPKNAERKIFRFGARKEKKSNQNEKNLARKFRFCGARIAGIAVPKLLWLVSAVTGLLSFFISVGDEEDKWLVMVPFVFASEQPIWTDGDLPYKYMCLSGLCGR